MLVLGCGFKRVIVDPLIRHGVIPLVIATLGLSIALKTLVRAGYSAEAHPFPSPFPDGPVRARAASTSRTPTSARWSSPALIVVGLQAFLNKTVTGRAMQAVAQNTDAAQVLGINVKRMVLYTFLINAVLAVVAALLVTPTYLAKFDMGDSIGQKAFFAAIIGGFNQTRGALLGGVLIGVLENLVGFYVSPAYKEGVALVLFLRRDPVPARRPARQGRGAQGMSGAQRKIAALLVVGARRASRVAARPFLKRSDVYLLTLCCVYLMATFGLNLTVGYAGQMSLGQAAFFGIGAYIAAILLKARLAVPRSCCRSRRSPASSIGLALGFPALRVQHHYLAFATLGFNVLVFLVMRNEEKLTGGTFGISDIPRPVAASASRSTAHLAFFYFTLASLIVLALAAVVAAALAVGPRVRGAARQPDPRREPRRQHHRLHAARVRDRRRLRRRRRRLLRVAGRVHRARTVPLLDVAHDAARGHRRRLGPLLRPGGRHGHHRPAAGAAARRAWHALKFMQNVVSRVLRRRGRRADDLAARRHCCRSPTASRRAERAK